MLSLSQKIQIFYPELQNPEDWEGIVIKSDVDNPDPYIAEWVHSTLAQPTQAELDSVDEAAYLNGKALEALRQRRNQLLAETDHLALSDHVLSAEMTAYRQALRDLPANTVDPANPVWPVKPGGNS